MLGFASRSSNTWLTFQAKNNIRSSPASTALAQVSHRSHNARTANRHLWRKEWRIKAIFLMHVFLRYKWSLTKFPHHCYCGKAFIDDHAMVCPTGEFPTIRPNEIRDLTASLLTEVCYNVTIEPCLWPLNGVSFSHRALPMLRMVLMLMLRQGISGRLTRMPFFVVRVFYPNASSYHSGSLSSLYRKHEQS